MSPSRTNFITGVDPQGRGYGSGPYGFADPGAYVASSFMSASTVPPVTQSSQSSLMLPESLSPDMLDAIPKLQLIIRKLETSRSDVKPSPDNLITNGEYDAGVHLQAPLSQNTSSNIALSGVDSGSGNLQIPDVLALKLENATNIGELALQNFASAADGIKHDLQRARAQLVLLPDMSRSISEQQAEIKHLEDRVRFQRAVLEMLKTSTA